MTTLHPPYLDDPALRRVLAALPGARMVGGCVRDAVLGRTVADIDLATPEPPDAVAARLRASGIKVVPTGLQHGTVTAVADGKPFEITTLRRDVSTDGRHATVAWTDNWQEDAARRDFTINAMSLSPDGVVHDYFGGLADLRGGRVRFVGDPAVRIAEDYLRILRFFRFFARFGAGEPDESALCTIGASVPGLARLSAERVWSELKRILAVPGAGPALRLMASVAVLPAVLPGAGDPALAGRLPPDPVLRLAALSPEPADVLAARFRLSNAERDQLDLLRRAPVLGPDAADDAVRRALADWPPAALAGAAWLSGGDGAALAERIARMQPVRWTLAGRDVVALGVPRGPAVGELLREVRDWWLRGGAQAGEAACRAELARLVAERRPG